MAALLSSVVGFAGLAYLKQAPVPVDAAYVGSTTCERCHSEEHEAWQGSLHTQMMRPVDDPGVVVADFGVADAGLRFEMTEAKWAIGGKWEQQFMGHDGEAETLLPGAWLGVAGHWDFTGWDGWEEPVPLRRCHGCHTVGLDVDTGEFVEPNIGCESCHGPGEWHVSTLGLGQVHGGTESEMCGQCHSRGRTVSGDYFFPAGFRPGGELLDDFVLDEPSPGQTSTSWWGNGSERRRHQEFTAWRVGGHSGALESIGPGYDGRYGLAEDDCLRCHSADYILAPNSHKPNVSQVEQGITCAVCHNVHGSLDQARISCDACHVGGPYYHEPGANSDHVPCPESAGVDCVDCHMPTTGRIGGALVLHSHRPGVVQPYETQRWGVPSSCGNSGCHDGEPVSQLQAAYDRHYQASNLAASEGEAPVYIGQTVRQASPRGAGPARRHTFSEDELARTVAGHLDRESRRGL